MNESERQSERLLNETMPLVSFSQALGKEITFFATLSKDLSKVNSEDQSEDINIILSAHIHEITRQLELLKHHGVDDLSIVHLQKQVRLLDQNFKKQQDLINEFLLVQKTLTEVHSSLERHHEKFRNTIQPRISENYRNFVLQGKEVASQIQHALDETPQSVKNQNNSIRVGIETLVNTVAGELRSNHEIIAATFESTGIMHEAANVDTIGRVVALQSRFEHLLPLLRKLQLVLSYTTPENSRVLLTALPIFKIGKGENSIFSLRKKELDLRKRVSTLADTSVEITSTLSNLAKELSDYHRVTAEKKLQELNLLRERAKIIQIVAGIGVVFVSIFIGWYYVGSQVISRIGALKKAMHLHAKGMNGDIPLDGKDEITDMAYTLQSFVKQRRQVVNALQQNVELLNEAQQIAKIGSCLRYDDGGSWEWSGGLYRLMGYEFNELDSTEENFWKHVFTEDRKKVQNVLDTIGKTSKTLSLDFKLIKKDGSLCSVSTRWKYTFRETTKSGVLHGTLLDVTEKNRIEAELHKVQKLESIGVLAGGIAHDFNNLLTAILGNISIVEEEMAGNIEARHSIRLAENATFRARDLTKRLLTFAKGGDPVKSVSDVHTLLHEAISFALHGSNVKCCWDITEEPWLVDVDAGQMNQVFHNLVMNADHAMPDGGTLTISCSNIFVDSSDILQLIPGHYVKIDISDEGCGIPSENIKRIFDPYFTTKAMDSTKGSGLGLAIVHSIVQRHDGQITVESTLGSGTTFTLYLPGLPEATAAPEIAPKVKEEGTGSVMVMDDEEMIRSVADAMLKKLGYEVLLTADGLEAVALYETLLLKNRKPDVVLMDLTVPGGMGGRKAAELILEKDPTAKIIVSSGYSNDDVLLQYKKYGFCGVANKPYDLAELAHVIAATISVDE